MRKIESGAFAGHPAHQARLLVADPPWRMQTYGKAEETPGSWAVPLNRLPPYETMTLDEICAMPVNDLCWCDCWLMLWTSGPFLQSAFQVMSAWGFKYSTIGFTWVKLRRRHVGDEIRPADFHRGLGKTTRKNTELVLFGKLGSPRVIGKPDELIVTPRREHSRKPDEFYDRAVEFAGYVPRVELFARQTRPGWTAIGDQASLFDSDAGPQAVARRGRRTA